MIIFVNFTCRSAARLASVVVFKVLRQPCAQTQKSFTTFFLNKNEKQEK